MSLTALCDATARWLDGTATDQPNTSYDVPVDVDESDAPGLTAALIAANRAGFLTESSQAGAAGHLGYDGALWSQLAAVSGFAPRWMLERLVNREAEPFDRFERRTGRGHGHGGDAYQVDWKPAGPWWAPVRRNGAIVTRRNGNRVTSFGNQLNRGELRNLYSEHPDAWDALYAAQQFAIWDPVAGRNTLWADLRRAANAIAAPTWPRRSPAQARALAKMRDGANRAVLEGEGLLGIDGDGGGEGHG